jgi:hypothetical protein
MDESLSRFFRLASGATTPNLITNPNADEGRIVTILVGADGSALLGGINTTTLSIAPLQLSKRDRAM